MTFDAPVRLARIFAIALLTLFTLVLVAQCNGSGPEKRSASEATRTTSAALTLTNVSPGDLSNIGTGDFDINFWITVPTSQASLVVGVIGQRSVCAHGIFWDIRLQNGNVLVETDDNTGSAGYTPLTSTIGVVDGNPHHVDVSRASGTLKILIDGKAAGSKASSSNFTRLSPTSTGIYGCVNGPGTAVLAGTLANPTVNNQGVFAGDLSNNAGNFTIAFWLRTSQNTGSIAVVGQRNVCGYGDFWDVRIEGGFLSFESDDANGKVTYQDLPSTKAVADGAMHSVLIERVNGTATIAIDGVAAGSGPSPAAFGSLPQWTTGVYGCVNHDNTVPLGGTLQNAPSPQEIANEIQTVTTGATPPVTGAWDATQNLVWDLSTNSGAFADQNIAVSESHVVITQRASIGFYTRQGKQVTHTSGDAMWSGQIPTGTAPTTTSTPAMHLTDIRTVFDQYRDRFVISGISNGPPGDGGTSSNISRFYIAMSKTADPTAGWCAWGFLAGQGFLHDTGIDYDQLSVGPDAVMATYTVDGQNIIRLFSGSQMASCGTTANVSVSFFTGNTGGDNKPAGMISPAMMHKIFSDHRIYAISRYDLNGTSNVTIFDIANPGTTPTRTQVNVQIPNEFPNEGFFNAFPIADGGAPPSTQSGSPEPGPSATTFPVGMYTKDAVSGLYTFPLKAVYSSFADELGFVTNDAHDWGGGATPSIHFVTVNTDTNTVTRNRKVGCSGCGVGWPGVEVTPGGDWGISWFVTSATSFPHAEYSLWGASDSDIQPSVVSTSGEQISWSTTQCGTSFGSWCNINSVIAGLETASASLDPSDNSIWFSTMLPENGAQMSFGQWATKAFGYPICSHELCSTGLPLAPTCQECVARVCASDSFCCNTQWDSTCVGEVTSLCSISCP